jgi:hypothetical protein
MRASRINPKLNFSQQNHDPTNRITAPRVFSAMAQRPEKENYERKPN